MTGVDLPIPELQLTMHQPTIKEISMLGERSFLIGIQILTIDKRMYISDEEILAQTNNFNLFIQLMNEKEVSDKKEHVLAVLSLLFPSSKIILLPRAMILNSGSTETIIDEGNFEILQSLLVQCFCISGSEQEHFNPKNEKARQIAQKLMKGRQRVAELKAEENSGSAFAQYLSILTVGLDSMSLKDCLKLTVYQMYNLIERYSMYINWDIDIRSRLAGAKADKPIESWMKQIQNR